MSREPFEIDDVRTEDGHECYLVRPETAPAAAGVIYLHWFDEAPNANRTQFLPEAKLLAARGVASILPQLTFPWAHPPTDIDGDLASIDSEVAWLRETRTILTGVAGDGAPLAVVGHDFGAMHGLLLLREIEAAAAVAVAPTPRWGDWFLTFWPIASDRFDYARALDPFDPVRVIADLEMPLLLQFGTRDFYISRMSALELFQAANEPKELREYETGHAMDLDEIQADRIDFLSRSLGLGV